MYRLVFIVLFVCFVNSIKQISLMQHNRLIQHKQYNKYIRKTHIHGYKSCCNVSKSKAIKLHSYYKSQELNTWIKVQLREQN